MSIAIETLLKQRGQLIAERDKMLDKFRNEIADIDEAIHSITGRKGSEVAAEFRYDDESQDYIKQSIEEI